MANRVLIEVVGQGQGLDEVNAKLEQTKTHEKELIDQMNKLTAQKAQWAGAAKVVSEFDKEIAKTEKDLKDTRKSIDDLSKAQKAMPGKIIAENTTKSFRALKRELDEQLRTWDDWSATGTAAYNKILAKAGEMNDTMGDTNRMVQYMGSDTKGFDTLVDGTQAVAGGFAIAQGAMALFGAENKDLEQIMIKLQSVIAISTGLQQLGNVVQKDSNLMMGIAVIQNKAKAAAELAGTKATIGATIAQRAFNLVAKANPYVLLAMALITVVGALVAFSAGSKEAEKEQNKLNNTLERTSVELNAINDKADFDIAMAKASGASSKSVQKMAEDYANAAVEVTSSTLIMVRSAYAAGKATKEQYDQATKDYQNAVEKQTKIITDGFIAQRQAETDAAKKAGEKRKEDDDKRKQYLADIAKQLADSNIEIMKDGLDKEVALINLEFDRKIALIKGNSEKEIQLRENLEIEKHQRISAISGMKTLESEQLTGDGVVKIFENTQNQKSEILANATDKMNENLKTDIQNEKDASAEKLENAKSEAEAKVEVMQRAIDLIGEIGDTLFQHQIDQLNSQSEDLNAQKEHELELAGDNAKAKEAIEKRYATKQLEIKRKIAQAEKNQAIFSALINGAVGVTTALASAPPPYNFILAAITAAATAVQVAAIVSKPLPKYWKGRKGGDGEFALVGEHGPELMWIPEMAGIMPANDTQRALNGDTSMFERWNMPAIDSRWIPLPDISQRVNQELSRRDDIDYDKLASKIGEHVGRNVRIPKTKQVTVNVDQSGITVDEGNTRTRILNKKYGL